MAAYWKSKNKTLIDVLNELYEEYGYYIDHNDSFSFEGIEGQRIIADIMSDFRNCDNAIFGEPHEKKDYWEEIDGFPKTNVLKFIFHDGSWLAVRPSGTEPKIKFYYSLRGTTKQQAIDRLDSMRKTVFLMTDKYKK